jgi:DNA repair exonuclease SbcCD ATPase subunit
VELSFELDGCEYHLRRSLPAREVILRKADEIIASGTRPLTEKLVSLVGVDVKLFQNIFYSDQDELRKSLDSSPEERRVFIERLLGVQEWKSRIETLRETKRNLEGFLDDLTSGRLGAFLTHMEELEQDISSRKKEASELKREIRGLKRSAPKDLDTLRREERSSENVVADLQHKELKAETELRLEQALLQGVRSGKCPTCAQPIPPALKRSRLAVLGRLVRELQSELSDIRRDLRRRETELAEEDFNGSYEALQDLGGLKASYDMVSRQIASDGSRLKKLRRQARTFGKKPRQVEETKAEISFLAELEEVIQHFRRSLRKRLVEQLVLGMNDFLARFHDGDNDTIVVIDGDLNISVQLHRRDVPIFNLSGAAKDILALSLRYGLLRVAARGISFLVLDEPTRHMDPSNCRKLKTLFNDLLDRQLIVVTVNSEFSDAAGRHFRVEKDDSLHSVVVDSW